MLEGSALTGPSKTVSGEFDDVLGANRRFAENYRLADLEPHAARGLAVLTCMDSRLDPLGMLGLEPGDAHVLRNPGARVTGDVLATLVLAHHLLGVTRSMVVAHTKCAMASRTDEQIHRAIAERGGPDTRSLAYLTTSDQEGSLRTDVQRVRSSPYLAGLTVGGFVYDVGTGRVQQVC